MMDTMLGERLYTEKMVTLFAMMVITFLCGMLPLKLFSQLRQNSDLSSRTRWETFISLCSCFSGGVFIAACFLDLIPDVEEKILEVTDMNQTTTNINFISTDCGRDQERIRY